MTGSSFLTSLQRPFITNHPLVILLKSQCKLPPCHFEFIEYILNFSCLYIFYVSHQFLPRLDFPFVCPPATLYCDMVWRASTPKHHCLFAHLLSSTLSPSWWPSGSNVWMFMLFSVLKHQLAAVFEQHVKNWKPMEPWAVLRAVSDAHSAFQQWHSSPQVLSEDEEGNQALLPLEGKAVLSALASRGSLILVMCSESEKV